MYPADYWYVFECTESIWWSGSEGSGWSGESEGFGGSEGFLGSGESRQI